jgi:hypothetical protein
MHRGFFKNIKNRGDIWIDGLKYQNIIKTSLRDVS